MDSPSVGSPTSRSVRRTPRLRSRRWAVAAALLIPVALAGCQLPAFGAFPGSTSQGKDAFKLWQGFFIGGLVLLAIVGGLIMWSVFRYRRHHSAVIPKQSQYHIFLEITYTVIPIIAILVLFAFSVITENEVDATPAGKADITVTAFQWGWQFYYPATGKLVEGETTEAPQMVVPAGQNVAITLKSADVIHGFYVPQFNFSRYAQPGVVNHFNFNVTHPGTYRGQCTQLCGLYHSLMYFSVKAVPPAQFKVWVHQGTHGANQTINQLKSQIAAKGPGA